MRKTRCIAVLFLCGLSGLARGESAVTLYGVVDAGLRFERVDLIGKGHASRVGLAPNGSLPSRFGLRGQSPLGDGWRTVFQLESGFNPVTGRDSGRLFGRDTYIGLSRDGAGSLKIGRLSNISDSYIGLIDPFGEAYGLAGADTTLSNSLRTDNTIMLESADMSGFSAAASYSFEVDSIRDELASSPQRTDTNRDHSRLFSGGLKFAAGPLALVASYDRYMPRATLDAAGTPESVQAYLMGGVYAFPAFKLGLAVGRTQDGWMTGKSLGNMPDRLGFNDSDGKRQLDSYSLARGFRATSSVVGVTVPTLSGEIMTSWQRATANSTRLTGGDSVFNVYSLGYRMDLSKRSAVYAFGSYATNYAFLHDVNATSLGVGLRHLF